jgi:hypothetical protein
MNRDPGPLLAGLHENIRLDLAMLARDPVVEFGASDFRWFKTAVEAGLIYNALDSQPAWLSTRLYRQADAQDLAVELVRKSAQFKGPGGKVLLLLATEAQAQRRLADAIHRAVNGDPARLDGTILRGHIGVPAEHEMMYHYAIDLALWRGWSQGDLATQLFKCGYAHSEDAAVKAVKRVWSKVRKRYGCDHWPC